jgi:hypothetical protein
LQAYCWTDGKLTHVGHPERRDLGPAQLAAVPVPHPSSVAATAGGRMGCAPGKAGTSMIYAGQRMADGAPFSLRLVEAGRRGARSRVTAPPGVFSPRALAHHRIGASAAEVHADIAPDNARLVPRTSGAGPPAAGKAAIT